MDKVVLVYGVVKKKMYYNHYKQTLFKYPQTYKQQ